MIILFETAVNISYLELLMKGGWLMYPLGLLSLITVYIFFDRYFYIQRQKRVNSTFLKNLKDLINEGKAGEAAALCESSNCSESRILLKGVQNLGQSVRDIRERMEMEGKLEVYKYEGNMYFLGVIAGIAPMMGFIGTISGVIKIFYNISLADNISISLISGGLYEKLISSGVGLGIGIIAYVSYHFLNNKINKLVQNWEFQSIRFIDLINNIAK
jgi:biopolymer transport protein ExbB